MTTKIVEHNIRKISFSIDESKPYTEADEQLISAYLKLYDKENLLKVREIALREACRNLNEQTEEVRISLSALKEKITAVTNLADSFVIVSPNKEQKGREIFKATDKVNKSIQDYHILMEELPKKTDECSQLNHAFIEDVDNYDLWEVYDKIKSDHFDNHRINSIDIVSFEEDDNQFREVLSSYSDQHDRVTDYANESMDNYNTLVLETEIQYNVWKEFIKRLTLIRMVIDSQKGETFISAN